jgi:glyoxylase-like metal-dependent hydrolase (beta-lactamase superfamily II)
MRTRKPGKIRDGLWLLGREESAIYLLEGSRESMLINGGTCYLVPDVLGQLREFRIDETRIQKLLILHAHFDHVGIVPFLQRRRPDLEVYASARAWEILQMPKAVKTINEYGHKVAVRMGAGEAYKQYDVEWRDDVNGRIIAQGDQVNLGEFQVSILDTPGHSSCSISAYVPQLKAVFASDGGGIPFKETIVISGNSNFTQYEESLEKLRGLDVEFVCADHYGCVSGEEAKGFFDRTIALAARDREMMEEIYRRTRDIDEAACELVKGFYRENADYILSPDIFEGIYRQMVRHIAKMMDPK